MILYNFAVQKLGAGLYAANGWQLPKETILDPGEKNDNIGVLFRTYKIFCTNSIDVSFFGQRKKNKTNWVNK